MAKAQSDVIIWVPQAALSIAPKTKKIGITYIDDKGLQITILMPGSAIRFLQQEIENTFDNVPGLKDWTSR